MQQQQTTTEAPQDSFFYDHLKCTVCLEIAIDASESSCCHNIYCESCLTISKTQNNNCPTCREQNFEIVPSHLGRRLIRTIPTSCPFKCEAKITYGDLENHKKNCSNRVYKCGETGCEDFQGDNKSYTQHIISKHSDKIIPAIEAMIASNKFTKSGILKGYYLQAGEKHAIEGTFRMDNGKIYVNTVDEVGPAGWKGEIKKDDLSVKLIKTYHGSHQIIYKGKFDKELIKLTGRYLFDDGGYEIPGEGFELNFLTKEN